MRLCTCYVTAGVLSLVIILGLRGLMNVWSRMDYILNRLDDYPQLYDSYQKELQEWDSWWIREDLEGRADEASVIYRYLDPAMDESEKLDYIARLLDADDARIISADEQEASNETYYIDEASDSITCISPVDTGSYISLQFSDNLKSVHFSSSEITDSLIRRVVAGLPGHILIQHEGVLSVYPKDDDGAALQKVVENMLARGELNPDEQRRKAEKDKKTSSVSWKFNVSSPGLPQGRYIHYSSAYSGNADYVIGAVPTSEMLRLAGKRSWSLWFLYISLLLLLGAFLWRAGTYPADNPADTGGGKSKKHLLLAAGRMLLVFSIMYIQQMSAIAQSEQSATEEASFLEYVLKDEEERRESIRGEYDYMYSDRAQSLASLLYDHPEMIDPDQTALIIG